MRLILVSGLSGSGKSVVLNTLEDNGYYCTDNLPINLLPAFVNELKHNSQNYLEYAAVGIDARANLENLQHFPSLLAELKSLDIQVEVVFLTAKHSVLLKRFSETRRKHPLSQFNRPLREAIDYEIDLLGSLERLADTCIDTSSYSASELKQFIINHYSNIDNESDHKLSLLFQSFGFKHGLPSDTSFVFDVRCLPNPHWVPELRPLTGQDTAVQEYLGQQEMIQKMIQSIITYIDQWLPAFDEENRRYMTICIGCTGGQHRSVYIVEQLYKHYQAKRNNVSLRHRELS